MMIKNGHLSAVFLLRKSQPAVRICQATTVIPLAFLFSVSAYSQIANPSAAPDPSLAASNEAERGHHP